MMCTSVSKETKAKWTDFLHLLFLNLCIEETSKGNRPGTHFTKEGWRNLIQSFFEETGLKYTKMQLKNHWDLTRDRWKVWGKLIRDENMKWDSETKTFGASENDWSNFIKENPVASHFRSNLLQHIDLLDILFEGSVRTANSGTLAVSKRKNGHLGVTPTKKKVRKDLSGNLEYHHSTPSSSIEKVKASWTPLRHKIFVDICVEELLKGNRPGGHFNKEGWRNIIKAFNERTGLSYTRLQLKNHWDSTREQWRIWYKLIGTVSMKWDRSNKRFGASEEDWDNYLQEHQEAAQFRYEVLPLTKELDFLFKGTKSTKETETPDMNGRYDDTVMTSVLDVKEPQIAKASIDSPPVCDAVESRSAVLLNNATAVSSLQAKATYSIGECIDCLDEMDEIEQGGDLYLFALDIFLKKEYREIFLQLKKAALRVSWLQRLYSVGPSVF